MGHKGKYYLFLFLVVIIFVSIFYPLPYYVEGPGSAQTLDPIVNVKGGEEHEDGDFMFTTVQFGKANIWEFLYARYVSDFHVVVPEEAFLPEGRTEKELNVMQLHMMDHSQLNAAYLAYQKAGKNPEIVHKGLLVVGIFAGMPAEKKLKPGDIIIRAAGTRIKTFADLQEILQQKKPGDHLKVTVKRDGKRKMLRVGIGKYPPEIQSERNYGLGITIVPLIDLDVSPPVEFQTGGIGGPSAGLMFALEIYDQLTEGNLTRGYLIAGTGEISRDGTVGPIGGIRQKVVAADRQNAAFFFAPHVGGQLCPCCFCG